ncbi:MAG: bifunctional riboflavin kinase/FAD synthetase [Methylobacteriaceae bacterium]|jgi:riboflavin kinase/FMN adenylyltransferase|nr:bifunctional riboflavin kinase/FAD synthetase [Methylobacteriaceae bacterium]
MDTTDSHLPPSPGRTPEPPPFVVWRDGGAVPPTLRQAVMAVGNFDGLHQGHRVLIQQARELAGTLHKPSAAMTFEPHPMSFFRAKENFVRLTPEGVKLAILAHFGVNGVFLKTFDAALAAMDAGAFMTWLFDDIGVGGLVIGHDFHFGAGRTGTPAVMAAACRARGVPLIEVPAVKIDGVVVSSSVIRAALREGDIARANLFLGYRWFVRAEVQHGEKRGRSLGFPTANMRLDDACPLKYGVYAVRARVGNRVFSGVASFGKRPTFDDGAPRLEVFLFDFSGNLYGQSIDVEYVAFVREEKRFPDVAALVAAMNADCLTARTATSVDTTPSIFDE